MANSDDLRRAGEHFASVLREVPESAFDEPTPCSEWDVRALLNHVVRGTLMYTSTLRAGPDPDRSLDYVGANALVSFEAASSEFAAEIFRPGVLAGTYQNRRGPVAGETLLGMRINEYLVHAWDLAVATGQSAELPEDLALATIAFYEGVERERPREANGAFALQLKAVPDASPTARLAAFFGRSTP